MATLLNDRDKILQAAAYRSKTTVVSITSTSGGFKTAKNGGATLAVGTSDTSITLTATPNSVFTGNATYTWEYALSATPNTWVFLDTVATIIITNTDFLSLISSSSQVQFRCTVSEDLLDTAYGFFTILYTLEPSEPIVTNLTRTNAVLSSDASGAIASFANTDTTITVTRGNVALAYSATPAANSFNVTIDTKQEAGRVVGTTSTTTSTSYIFGGITALAVDGAKVVFIITVYDASGNAISPTIGREIVYSKIANGSIGADGANLYPILNYDFAGATLPSGVTYPGNTTASDSGTTTTIQNTGLDQNLRLTNLNLVPANSYIISMRVKFISGTWEGYINYVNPAHVESASYYKAIPQPVTGVWTTINLDMRTLTVGGTEYMTGGTISQLRFDFVNDTTSQVAIDYISVGKYGVAEATKSTTVIAYAWANTGSAPANTQAFTYNWSTKAISAYPTGYTVAAPASPGTGYTLYQLSLQLLDVSTAVTTTANWSTATVNTIGYRLDGSIGPRGQSYRTCYIVTSSGTAPTTPTAATGDKAPTNWSFTPPTSTLTSGQYMYQSDGILTGTPGDLTSATSISWTTPYLSNLKVGKLSAISADMGVITAGTLTAGTIFAGALSAATGEFAGTLRANVLDPTTFSGISTVYLISNNSTTTYTITVPTGKTSLRATLIGGGGGGGGSTWQVAAGGANNVQGGSGGGGGGTTLYFATNLNAGDTLTLIVGAGGSGGTGRYSNGGAAFSPNGGRGSDTTLKLGTAILAAGGGGGGGSTGYIPNTTFVGVNFGGGGGTGTYTGRNGGSPDSQFGNGVYNIGGAGGYNTASTGGTGAIYNTDLSTSGYGYGAGGGGGAAYNTGSSTTTNNSWSYGAGGTSGYALIEFFDSKSVVLYEEFSKLITALAANGIATGL